MLIDLLTGNTNLNIYYHLGILLQTHPFTHKEHRASKNLLETLPIFIGITILSLIKEIDNSSVL